MPKHAGSSRAASFTSAAALLTACLCALACSSGDDDAAGDGGGDAGSGAEGGRSGGGEAGTASGAAGRSGAGGAIASAGAGSAGTGGAGSGPRAGTGGRSGAGGDGGGDAGRSGAGGAGGKAAAGAGGQPAGDRCIVARRLDRCCPEYEAVLRSALADDECLNEEPGPAPDSMRAQRCFAQSPIDCTAVLCGPQPPPSRVATSDGAGGCHYVDECTSPDDCVIATHSSACCGCPGSMPAVLLEQDRCLLPEGTTAPQGCPMCETPVLCGQCAPPPEPVTCVIGDALNRCQ